MAGFKKKVINHVYVQESTGKFENVLVQVDFSINESTDKIVLNEDKLSVNIISKIDISLSDFEKVLNDLQKNNFDRLKISLSDDVNCFLYIKSSKYYVKTMRTLQGDYKVELIKF